MIYFFRHVLPDRRNRGRYLRPSVADESDQLGLIYEKGDTTNGVQRDRREWIEGGISEVLLMMARSKGMVER